MANNLNYRFHTWVYTGTAWLDNYQELNYQMTTYAYDVLNNLTGVTDAASNVTGIGYDKLGRKTSMTDPDMGAWYYTYDTRSNLTSQTDAKSQILNFTYDELNRLTSKSTGVTYSYDGILKQDTFDGSALPAGWGSAGSVSVSGGQAHITGSGTWATNVRRTASLPDHRAVHLAFRFNNANAIGWIFLDYGTYPQSDFRRWGLYVEGGTIYRDVYEGANNDRVALMSLQANVWYEALLVLDGAGQFRARVWKRDDAQTQAERVESRPTWAGLNWTFADYVYTGTQDLDDYQEFQAYGLGQRMTMTDTTGSATWVYDARGRVLTETKVITGAGTFATSFGYDAMDRVITMTYPSGEVVTQTYNAASQLTQVRSTTNNLSYARGMTYNAPGQLTQMTYGNNAVTNYTYDSLNLRLKRIQVGSLLDLSYRYDAVGNVKAITDTANSGQVQSFNYDALDRLIAASTNSAGSGQYSESYQYNAIGNITNKAGVTYWYSDTLHKHATTHLGGVQKYWYDANGNMTRRDEGSTTYNQTWDVENRLSTVTVNGQTTTFYYDGDGKRVKKVQGGQTTAYLGAHYEKNVTTGVTTTYYYAGSTRVAMRQGSVVSYLHADHLGSASLTTNASGTTFSVERYYPYGVTRYGSSPTDRQFTGQRKEDASLGSLYDYGARFYSPVLGRFLSADTIVPSPANPQSLNRYSYVSNNPLKYTDPTGHMQACADGDVGGGCGSPGTWTPSPPPLVPWIPSPATVVGNAAPAPAAPQLPEGRFLGLTSNDWSQIGLFPDFGAVMINMTFAAVADLGFAIPAALGHPEIGVVLYGDAVLGYQATSVIPNLLSTAGWGCTVASGIASGENSIVQNENGLSISISQDTLNSTVFTAAGWIIKEPNLGTVADGWVYLYDWGRVDTSKMGYGGTPGTAIPTLINPTLNIQRNQDGGFRTNGSVSTWGQTVGA